MFNIIRRDPFREMLQFRNTMDRMLVDAFSGSDFDWVNPWDNGLPLDIVEKDNEYIVSASLPGIKPEDLDITFTGNSLNIKGEIKSDDVKEEGQYHLRERRYGSFARSITLPSCVNGDKTQATYEAGILKLHVPKSEEAKPKRITVKTSVPKMIEGKAREIIGKN
jgi:HSP20 family protein